MGNKFSMVIFDIDGTLADTHQLIFDSFNFVLRKYKSIELTPQEIMSYFGPPEEVCIRNMIGEANFFPAWHDYLYYYEIHIDESVVFSGVPELLNGLKESGSSLGIFTGKGADTTDMTLKHHGLKDLFDVVVTGSNVTNHKPHPEGIELALRRFNVEPNEAVLIGDSLADYKAAASSGAHFIAVVYDGLLKNHFDGLDCTVANSVGELRGLLLPDHIRSYRL
ncbi:MAG: HAD family hydrolase [Candidatus Kryptoniota bacterium]